MSLRVRAPLPPGEIRRSAGGAPMGMDDGYMSRLVKLVPAEAIGPFPFLMDYARQVQMQLPDGSPRWTLYFVAWALLIVVIVLRARATSAPELGQGPQWGSVMIAAVAFFIWVHVMGGDFGLEMLVNQMVAGPAPVAGALPGAEGITRSPPTALQTAAGSPELKAFMANVSLMLWTTLAPVVYRGEDPA
jgi:hypothetical protein